MPFYEYRCEECKSVQEELQSMGAGPEGVKCKKCGSEHMRKVLSVIARTPGSSSDDFCDAAGTCPSGGNCQGCGNWD